MRERALKDCVSVSRWSEKDDKWQALHAHSEASKRAHSRDVLLDSQAQVALHLRRLFVSQQRAQSRTPKHVKARGFGLFVNTHTLVRPQHEAVLHLHNTITAGKVR